MRTLLVDVFEKMVAEVEMEENKGGGYYCEALHCDSFTAEFVTVKGTPFWVAFDDKWEEKETPLVSAIDKDGNPLAYGNLFFFHMNGKGDWFGLNDREIKMLKESIKWVKPHDMEPHPIVAFMESR